jgi:hypothetical protein
MDWICGRIRYGVLWCTVFKRKNRLLSRADTIDVKDVTFSNCHYKTKWSHQHVCHTLLIHTLNRQILQLQVAIPIQQMYLKTETRRRLPLQSRTICSMSQRVPLLCIFP